MLGKPLSGMRINPAHPLAQGMVGCWLFNSGSGWPSDSVGTAGVAVLGGAQPAWVSDGTGVGINFAGSGTSYYTLAPGKIIAGKTNSTIVAGILPLGGRGATGSSGGVIYSERASGGGGDLVNLQAGAGSGVATVSFVYRDDNNTATFVNGTTSLFDGNSHIIMVSKRDLFATVYADGVKQNSGAVTGNRSMTTASVVAQTGQNIGVSLTFFTGNVHFIYLYGVALNDWQAAALAQNPYQMWTPVYAQRFYSVSGGTVSGTASLLGYGTTTFVSQAAGTATILPDVSVAGISQAAGVSSIAGVGLVTSVSQAAGVATLTGIGTLNATSLGTVVGTATLVGVGAIITVGQAAGTSATQGSAIVISISQAAGTSALAGAGLTHFVSQAAGVTTLVGFGTLTATSQGGTVVSGSITMTGAGVLMAYGYLYTAPIPTPINEGGWSAGSVGPGDWTSDTVPAGGWTSKVILPGGWE